MEIIIVINTLICLITLILVVSIHIETIPKNEITKKKTPKKPAKKKKIQGSAKNSNAVNSVVDFQKIKSAEIEIPVIAADVLTYEGGELGTAYPERTRLYYSEEAISDPEYLETVMRSPFQMETHQKNTSEFNRDVDGWPTKVWFDESEKRVKAKGIIHGEENVEYALKNKNLPGFGTSAFISFLKIDKEPGTAPNGKPYDAIVRKAVNNHVAILPNVRDPKNIIVAMNAVEEKKEETKNEDVEVSNPASWVQDEEKWKRAKEQAEKGGYTGDTFYKVTTDIYKKMGGKIKGENAMSFDKEEFRKAMNEYEKEKAEKDEAINKAVKNELEKREAENKAKNEEGEKEPEKEPEKKAENEEKKEKEEEDAMNAILPSDDMIKDFSHAYGITFSKTPSLKVLAKTVGVEAKTPAEMISALNAKREELKKPSAQNSAPGKTGTEVDLLSIM